MIEAADEIGGGARSSELTLPGLIHDDCSAVHAMAVGAPALLELDLARHGLEWCWPEIDLAHPLDSGEAPVMLRSIDETAAGLDADGANWRRIFGAPAAGFDDLGEDIYRPMLHVPRHPLRLVRFGLPAAAPATLLAGRFKGAEARALFGGVAAHAFRPLSTLMSSSVGMALICACHRYGWPVARGGSASDHGRAGGGGVRERWIDRDRAACAQP